MPRASDRHVPRRLEKSGRAWKKVVLVGKKWISREGIKEQNNKAQEPQNRINILELAPSDVSRMMSFTAALALGV